jgi:phospholipase D1/2
MTLGRFNSLGPLHGIALSLMLTNNIFYTTGEDDHDNDDVVHFVVVAGNDNFYILFNCSKGNLIEHSIFRAYIQMIRNANSFIYIENQYFLGSAFAWSDDNHAPVNHTIPIEIVKKIEEKIESGEPFAAYVLIPMFPEGIPEAPATQEILFWQYRTMESMYKRIAVSIEEYGVEASPSDYLMFFCLGKQEGIEDVPEDLEPAEPETPAEIVRTTLRHPIYVHSKMMIVDDDYVIVGSANINQRSMGGNRDTEIAFGSWQPGHKWNGVGSEPRGGIHAFRVALWSAHLGGYDEAYLNPSSGECIEKVSF